MPRPTTGTDVYIYEQLDKITPSLCKNNIHPNVITFISLYINKILFDLFKNFPKNKKMIFILMLSHRILDCLDGEVARACNKYSQFGSYLDYFNDQLFMSIILLYILHKKIGLKYSPKHLSIITICIFFFNKYILQINLSTHQIDSNIGEKLHDNSCLLCIIIYFMLICFSYHF